MSKSAMIRARTEPDLKNQVEDIFKKLGLTTTAAINLFYHHVLINNGIPFELKIPNDETVKVFEETDKGENLNSYENIDDMFASLKL